MATRYGGWSTLRAGALAALLSGCDSSTPAAAPAGDLSAPPVAATPASQPKFDPGCPPWERPEPCKPGVWMGLKALEEEPWKALFELLGSRHIHDEDDRVDVYCVQNEPGLATPIGASVALVWPENYVEGEQAGTLNIKSGFANELCSDEAFAAQTQGAACSGVLVAPHVVLTMRKCFGETLYDRREALLDFRADAAAPDGKIAIELQDRCRPIPGAIRKFSDDTLLLMGVECGGPPRDPAPLATAAPADGETVYAIGYPGRLPAKFSGRAHVSTTPDGRVLHAMLDTMWGNSGSPVFNERGEVFGVITGSDIGRMQCRDNVNNCRRWRACTADDKACVGTTIRLATEAKELISELEAEIRKGADQ